MLSCAVIVLVLERLAGAGRDRGAAERIAELAQEGGREKTRSAERRSRPASL